MTVYTAIIGPYETLKEPLIITPGWTYLCFTDQDFVSKNWEIRKIEPTMGNRLTARLIKIMAHSFVFDDFSMWVDGSFQINCDLDKWVAEHFQSPMTCIKHPIRTCVYEEAEACLKNKRGGTENLKQQVSYYRDQMLPPYNGLIQSGILMRENTKQVRDFCRVWFNQVVMWSMRDQVAFAFAAFKNPIASYMTYDYRTGKDFIFKSHYNVPAHRNT